MGREGDCCSTGLSLRSGDPNAFTEESDDGRWRRGMEAIDND